MGTRLYVGVAAPSREEALSATERVLAEIRRLEGVLSSWTADSEIGALNHAPPGEAVALSPELWSLLGEAFLWRERSGGAFDPSVGALVDAWDLRGEGRRPSASELAAALAASGRGAVHVDSTARTMTRASAAGWLDTGGFGKGTALRAAERILREEGVTAALLDFGGQVLALGEPEPGRGGWEVPVAHPARRGEPAAALRVRDASAATTAQSERFVAVGDDRFGHVLDPRTGLPVKPWGSVTVVAPDPMLADILSTALFVLGPDEGMRWAEGLGEEVGVLFLEDREGEVSARWNSVFERYRIQNSKSTTDK